LNVGRNDKELTHIMLRLILTGVSFETQENKKQKEKRSRREQKYLNFPA
jgi:hypothetical protein